MTPMGERVGTKMARSMKLWVVCLLCFLLGVIITISEPDLQVLAEQVPSIPNVALILAVAFGVGFFLVAAMMRMLFSRSLPSLLILCYIVVFLLAFLVPEDFLAVSFDSGGVTTGPMTVPFIMSMGVGFAAVRSDEHAEADSFGLVSLCSIGPILAVLLLGLLYHPGDAVYTPAVYVLMEQVEEITSGAISGQSMGQSLSLGVAVSIGLAMTRVLTGVSIFWFILPGYVIAICLSFFVPKIFTAIEFDSGGVASGPMTATFLLPFAMGACQAVGGNIVRDAFGIVAMVAMTPLIAIQIQGAVYKFRAQKGEIPGTESASYLDILADDDIIEL